MPLVRLEVRQPARFSIDEATIDTGFGGGVYVPAGTFAKHGIHHDGMITVQLADGSEHDCPFASGIARWLGDDVQVEIIEHGRAPLVGMTLLVGCQLDLFSDHVIVRRLPP